MKSIDICGVGNSIVDIPVGVPQDTLDQLSFPAGSSRLVTPDEQAALIAYLKANHTPGALTAAGSVANSIVTVSELNGSSAFAARLADDEYGRFYQQEFGRLKVKLGNPLVV